MRVLFGIFFRIGHGVLPFSRRTLSLMLRKHHWQCEGGLSTLEGNLARVHLSCISTALGLRATLGPSLFEENGIWACCLGQAPASVKS